MNGNTSLLCIIALCLLAAISALEVLRWCIYWVLLSASMLLRRSPARLGACGRIGARALFSGSFNDKSPLPQPVDEALRGVGQVVFCNSAGSGALILAGLGVGDPYLAAMAAVGATSATAAAKLGGLDASSGLCGYNGTLVGCAFAVFLGTSAPVTLAATVAGAAATPFVSRAIAPLCGSAPQFTLAFNAVALSALALVRPLAAKTAEASPDVVAAAATGVTDLLLAPLTGVGQIFLVESPLSGALLLGAIGVYSPMCALATLSGSSIGAAVGAIVDAPAADIAAGLWGYNPVSPHVE